MKENIRFTTVNGIEFEVWTDIVRRATVAMDLQTGEVKAISSSGYVSNDLSVRKAIANRFALSTFRR